MNPPLDRALLWFRRDLRTDDHAALYHALRAARAAWGMQQALGRFNEGTDHRLTMRIGLNCGKIVRGDIGSR